MSFLFRRAALAFVLFFAGGVAFCASVVFEPALSGRVGHPDWRAAFSHMSDRMTLIADVAETPSAAPVRQVAAFVLRETALASDSGKATYFRSRALDTGGGRFTVEWQANIRPGAVNPSMELWGKVGAKANDQQVLLLRLEVLASGDVRQGKDILGRIESGWNCFRIDVNPATLTYDGFWGGGREPVARNQPLNPPDAGTAPDWSRIGVGWILYVAPGTPPLRWEIGGIKVSTTGSGAVSAAAARARELWRPAAPESRLVILEGDEPGGADVLYSALAADAEPGRRIALDVAPCAPVPPSAPRGASKAAAGGSPVGEVSAAALAGELGLDPADLPAAVLTRPDGVVQALWKGPFDTGRSADLVAALKDSAPQGARVFAQLPAAPVSDAASPPMPLQGRGDTPALWLTLGTWAGSAGLSLWGLDYEAEISPDPGEPQIVTYWDSAWHARWEGRAPAADGTTTLEKLDRDYVWAKGTAYAHLYLYSPERAAVSLQVDQSGREIAGWLNGRPLAWRRDESRGMAEIEETSRNDQGGVMVARRTEGRTGHAARLDLEAGWNRLLVKLVMNQRKGETFAFAARFSAAKAATLAGLRTSVFNPRPAGIARATASRFVPRVHTWSPFNLVHPEDPLILNVDLGSTDLLGETIRPFIAPPVGRLELTVTDYDGSELFREAAPFALPGRARFDLGRSLPVGYYAVRLRLFDAENRLVHTYPPDGFSVIGGTAAQRARRDEKKMSVTYYFMAGQDRYRSLFFPYMERIGILRNIGGNPRPAPDFYREARRRGLEVIADTWTHRDPAFLQAYIEETAPYVETFKAFNEVDIHPEQRGTPESWVAKARMDYELIKKTKPSALMLGASLVRPGADSWFEECLKLGLADYHDAWDVHCYPQTPPVLEGSMSNGANETDLGVLKVYKKLGMENTKPFWIGETGARSGHGNDARRWQADMIVKMAACALSRADFQRIGFLVPWRYSRGENRYYIMDIEAGHMPAEAAFYTASALIDGFAYKRLSLGASIQAAEFGPTTLLWSVQGEKTVRFTPSAKGPLVRVDVVGRHAEIPRHPDGSVELAVGTSPVFVLSADDYARLTAF